MMNERNEKSQFAKNNMIRGAGKYQKTEKFSSKTKGNQAKSHQIELCARETYA